MTTCVRCGTQLAAGDTRCPFCSLPVAGDPEQTRMAPDPGRGAPGGWAQPPPPQQNPPQQYPPHQHPQQQYGQQPPQWGPGPGYGPPPGWGPGQPGQPWQGGPPGPPPRRGPSAVVLTVIAVAVLLVVGLGAWGIASVVSDDDGSDRVADPITSTSPSPEPSPSETDESEPTESPTPTPTPTEEETAEGGGSVSPYDLADGEVSLALNVTSPGQLDVIARTFDDEDIVLTINDPDGEEVCQADASFFRNEECSFTAEATGEYEILVGIVGGGPGGTGEVEIE